MNRNRRDRGGIRRMGSICMISLFVFSALLIPLTFNDESPGAGAETPTFPLGTLTGSDSDRFFGWNVSSAGDINDDGYDDIVVGAPFSGAVVEAPDWWNDNWTYRRRLTFENTDQNEYLTNFPVLVTLDPVDFDYAKSNPDASDIRFIDADGVTELAYHIEEWNSMGDSHIWVNVTEIDGNSNQDYMWMYYNNSAATGNVDVWGTYDSEFVGVWHLNESVGPVTDSTANGHGGAALGGVDRAFTGMVDGAYDFAGDDDYIDFGNDLQLMITGDITLEAWINIDTDPVTYDYGVMQFGDSGETEAENWLYQLALTPGGGGLDVDLGHEFGNGIDEKRIYAANLQLDNWYYLVATRDISVNEWRLYIDGAQFDTPFVYGSGPTGGGLGNLMVSMDWFNAAWRFTDGTMDELRLSSTPRSADWISAQYLSMTNNLITFGFEEKKNGTCGSAYIFLGGPGITGDTTAGNADIIINGSAKNDRFGWSVAAVDVVGDSTTDILVGAPGYNGGKDMGAVYVFDGDDLAADIDGLLEASEAEIVIAGENPGDEFGSSVSEAGDVNGDASYDFIVGAPEFGVSKGRAYLFFSGGSIPDLASGADVFMAGTSVDSRFGHSVSAAGDMNGDGFGDVVVGAPGENRAYIYTGGADMKTTITAKPETVGPQDNTGGNIDDLKRDDDSYYTIPKNGKMMFLDTFNISGLVGKVTSAILHIQYYTQNNYDTFDNVTWALDGQPQQDTDIELVQSPTDVTPPGYDLFARGVDTLDEIENLDINLINTAGGGQVNVFVDYVWIQVSTNDAEPAVILNASGDFGWSVSGSGDLNGDGLGDVIIGSPDLSGSTPGQTHVNLGNLQSFDSEITGASPIGWTQFGTYAAVINDSVFTGISGKSMELMDTTGGMDSVETRKTFSPAINGIIEFYARTSVTTTENLMVDVSRGDPGVVANMGARIYFTDTNDIRCMIGDGAGGNMPVTLQKYDVDTWYHFMLVLDSTTDTCNVWIDGDLKLRDGNFLMDNDLDDIDTLNIRTNLGGTNQAFIDEVSVLTSHIGHVITGESIGDQFGYSVAIDGNIDGDGFDDIMVGAPRANGNGTVFLFQGNDSWVPAITTASAYIALKGEQSDDCFGWSVSHAGDVNNDGQNNTLVGAPWHDAGSNIDAGKTYIFFGPYVTYQPDLLLNGAIDNVYQPVPGGAQINVSPISQDDAASWWITLQNDGNVNDTFDIGIAANMLPGWTWEMVENITLDAVGDGELVYLSPGESRNYTLNISSPASAVIPDESFVEITVRSQNGTTYDSVKAMAIISGDFPPEISDVQEFPDPQETGGSVNITCNVTDDIGVSGVWVNVTFPGGGFANTSMMKGAGDLWFHKNMYATLGLYLYTIWAEDTSGNWNSSTGYGFTIQDTTPSVISNVIDLPDPQETGGFVNISCDVTDNVGVDSVWINISLPGGGYSNVSMDPGTGGQWFHNNTFAILGLYQYTIWGSDTSGNWNSTTGQFVIQDTTLPSIADVTAVPDPQEMNGFVNISALVTDAVGVYGAWVEVVDPQGGFVGNFSMTYDNVSGRYFTNQTYGILGVYQFVLVANDTDDNWAGSSGYTFTIGDFTPPAIHDITTAPDPQEVGAWVNITCDVSDNHAVYNVWVNVTVPGGENINSSMIRGAGNLWFLNSTYSDTGLHPYSVWVNDSSGNWNSSTGHTFTVQDAESPRISNVLDLPDTKEPGGMVNISCDVTDNVNIDEVRVNISLPGGGYTNTSMTMGTGDMWYHESLHFGLGLYQYTIWVKDTSGNWNVSSGHGFTVEDLVPPEITGVSDSPDPQEIGGFVNTTCLVTDNDVVSTAWMNITLPAGGYSNVSMMKGPGSLWFLNSEYSVGGAYQYTIWAADNAGNWNNSQGHGFDILVPGPQLTGHGVDPVSGYSDTWFNFTVDYSHQFDLAPDTITMNYTGPSDGVFDMLEVNPSDALYTDGKLYYFIVSGIEIGMYSFHMAASDTAGEWTETGALGFEVRNRMPTLSLHGVDPETGYTDTGFNFTVEYTDPDGHSPGSITVNITGWGTFDLSETDPADQDFTDGKTYHVIISGLPKGTHYTFHFAARDAYGSWALETPETDAPDVVERIAVLTGYDKTAKYSETVLLNATLMRDGTPVEGERIDFYIDLNNNGAYEASDLVGGGQTTANGTVSLNYTVLIEPGLFTYNTVYTGMFYTVTNSTASLMVESKPATIRTYDKVIDEGQIATLNGTLEDEDGTPLPGLEIDFYVDRNKNGFRDGGELVGSHETDSLGNVEVTYLPTLKSGAYGIWARYRDSGNYSTTEGYAILLIQNTTNKPPQIVDVVPDQVKPEDSDPWTLSLKSHEWDEEDTDEDLRWYLTGIDTSLYSVTGMNETSDMLTFIPVKNAHGSGEATLWLVDSSGATAFQTLWINITPVNDRPKIESINPLTVHFDDEYTYILNDYVSDIETPVEDLVLSVDDTDHVTVDDLIITFLYPESMNGETVPVLVTVTDTDGGSTSTIVLVKISDDWVPELEKEIPDVTLLEGETLVNAFDLDDYFSDPDGDSLFYVTGQSHVTVSVDSVTHLVNITAPTDWFGTEIVIFHALDPSKARAEDRVLITVLPVNDMPAISGVPDLVVRFEQDYVFNLTPYISDEDNPPWELTLDLLDPETGERMHGVEVDPQYNLGMVINLPESLNGTTIQLGIEVSDGLDSASTIIYISISDDYPPELVERIPDVSFEEDTQLIYVFNIHSFFSDVDDVYLIYTTGNDKIIVTINPDGSVDFSAPPDWYGNEEVTFRAEDDTGALVEDTVTVSVIPVNDAPVLGQIPDQTGEPGKIWVVDIREFLTDIDNDIDDLIIQVSSPHVGVVGYTLIFEYPEGVEGETVTITLSDGSLNSTGSLEVTLSRVETPASESTLLGYLLWFILIPLILAALFIGFTMVKRRINAPFVEEVFLIANDGTLIAHNSLSLEEEIDRDILSGMLTGVKNLISDAFAKEEGRQRGLRKLEFGEKNIMLEKAEHFFIALVFSGEENRALLKKIQKVISELEEQYGAVFEDWTGDMEIFVDTDEILETLLSLEELSKEDRVHLREARMRLKEARELAIRELDLELVNMLAEEDIGAPEGPPPPDDFIEEGVD